MSRRVSVVYHLLDRGQVAFGLKEDVEFTTYFELGGTISADHLLEIPPKGTKVLVLYTDNQDNVRSDGYIVKGIAYHNKNDLLSDVRSRSRVLVQLFEDGFGQLLEREYERIYDELDRNGETEGGFGRVWTIVEVELP